MFRCRYMQIHCSSLIKTPWSAPVIAGTQACMEATLLLSRSSRFDLATLLLAFAELGLALSIRSSCYPGIPTPILDFVQFELLMSLRSLMQCGALLLVVGLVRTGLASLLLVVDCADFDPPTFLQSLVCLESLPLVLDFATSEVSLLIRSSEHADPIPLAFGLACLGSVFLLSATDCTLLESLVFLRSLAKSGVSVLVLDPAKLESPLLLHSFAQGGLLSSISGLICLGLTFLTLDHSLLGLSLLTQSASKLDISILAFGRGHLSLPMLVLDMCGDSPMLSKSLHRLDFASPVYRLAWSDLFMLLLDASLPGSSLVLRSLGRSGLLLVLFGSCVPGSFLLQLDHVQPDFNLSLHKPSWLDVLILIRSPGCLGFLLFVSDLATTGSLSPAQGVVALGLFVLLVGVSKSDPFSLVLDLLHSESSSSIRSHTQPGTFFPLYASTTSGLSTTAFDVALLELPLPLQSLTYLGFFVSMFGMV